MSQPQTPQKKTRPKGQPSPYSLFFAAFLAYMFGAPFGLVLFLVGLGIIFWRIQASAKNMAKLPPLPPARRGDEIAQAEQRRSSSDSQTSEFPNDTSWGRSQPSDETGIERLPERAKPSREAMQRIPDYEPQPMSAPQPVQTIRTQPEWSPSIAPPIPPALQRLAGRSTMDSRPKSRHRTPGLGVNLATQSGLRHAIVAMTVLGPCRSLDPYQEDPMHTGLPGHRGDSDHSTKTAPRSPQ